MKLRNTEAKEKGDLIEALKAVVPWLGKALADGAFQHCARPSKAKHAFKQAEQVLAQYQ